MSEEKPESAGSMMTRALIFEVVSLAGTALALWYLGPGKTVIDHWIWRVRKMAGRKQGAEDAAVAELRRDISAYEHGEAAL